MGSSGATEFELQLPPNNTDPIAWPQFLASTSVVNVPIALTHALRVFPIRLRNRGIHGAESIPDDHAIQLNSLLDQPGSIERIGPIISIFEEDLVSGKEFCVQNFLGADIDARHVGPKYVVINLGDNSIEFEIVKPDVVTLLRSGCFKQPQTVKVSLLANSLEIGLSEMSFTPDIARIEIGRGQALVFTPEMNMYRVVAPGRALILHGFFSPAN